MIKQLFHSPLLDARLVIANSALQISDFQHFYWLAGHRLSVHIPALPNMVKERVSNKASWKHFCSSDKNGRQKLFWTGIVQDKNRCFSGRVVDPGVFNKTIILLGLAGYKMRIITNSVLLASLVIYHFISSAPS